MWLVVGVIAQVVALGAFLIFIGRDTVVPPMRDTVLMANSMTVVDTKKNAVNLSSVVISNAVTVLSTTDHDVTVYGALESPIVLLQLH